MSYRHLCKVYDLRFHSEAFIVLCLKFEHTVANFVFPALATMYTIHTMLYFFYLLLFCTFARVILASILYGKHIYLLVA